MLLNVLQNFAEPGYYRDNEFGIRLENIVTVVKANVTVSKIWLTNQYNKSQVGKVS